MTRMSATMRLLFGGRDQEHLVDFVHLDELDLDALAAGGGQVLADVVGTDRQLAVAAVGEDRELDAGRAAVVEERLDRGADRPTGVEDVVDEDAGPALQREVELGGTDERLRVPGGLTGADLDVVPVEGDVDGADRHLDAGALLDQPAQPVGEWHAARVDADERHPLEVVVALDDLVGDPRQRPLDRVGVEEPLPRCLHCAHVRVRGLAGMRPGDFIRTPFRPRWTGLKGHDSAASLPEAPDGAGLLTLVNPTSTSWRPSQRGRG